VLDVTNLTGFGSGGLRPIATLTPVTMKLSTADGVAFIAKCSANLAASYVNRLIEIIDSGGKKAQAWIKAAGGGETMGDAIIVNGDMESGSPPSSWTAGGDATLSRRTSTPDPHGGAASLRIATTDYSGTAYQTQSVTAGILIATKGFIDGDSCEIITNESHQITSGGGDGTWWGSASYAYVTHTTSSLTVTAQKTAGTKNFCVDDIEVKQVTAPANSGANNYGVTLVNSKAGTTYNFISVQSGFNPKSANFTIVVYG